MPQGGFEEGGVPPLTRCEWSGQGAAFVVATSTLANYPNKRSLYKWALPYFPQCLLRSKIPLSISAPRPFAPDGHRTPESAPEPQDAGERPRRPRTPESAPDGHRTPESGPDGHRTPESGPDGHRTPESGPDGHRTPESAPDGLRTPAPQTATGRRRAPLGHRTPESALFSARSQPLVLDQVGGCGTPPFFYLIHLGRAPARAYARA